MLPLEYSLSSTTFAQHGDEPEVADLHHALVPVHEQVIALEVAVDHRQVVRVEVRQAA